MAKNEYVFNDTVRKPAKGITAHGRMIGDNEIHLQYAPKASCKFPGAAAYTAGQCLLTENNFYFVGNSFRKDRQYLEIPVCNIEKVKKVGLGLYLAIYVDAFEYVFSVPRPQDWMESIAKVKAEKRDQALYAEETSVETDSPSEINQGPQIKNFCPACGAKVESGDLYCCACGSVVNNGNWPPLG